MSLSATIQPLFNQDKIIIGFIISANIDDAITIEEKTKLESILKQEAYKMCPLSAGLLVFSEINNDWAKIVVLTDGEALLPETIKTIDLT